MGASRKDVLEATNNLTNALQRTINLSAIVGTVVSSVITIAGIAVELLLVADFGYVLIAIGILGIAIGFTLWRS
jgi:hypothetical protein